VNYYTKPTIASKFIDELAYNDPMMTLCSIAFSLQPYTQEVKFNMRDDVMYLTSNDGIASNSFLSSVDGTLPNSALIPCLKLSDKFWAVSTDDKFRTIIGVVKKTFVKIFVVIYSVEGDSVWPKDEPSLNYNLLKLKQYFNIDQEYITNDPVAERTYIAFKAEQFTSTTFDIRYGGSSLTTILEYMFLRNDAGNLKFVVHSNKIVPKFADKYIGRSD
jgi:hypothetical protein